MVNKYYFSIVSRLCTEKYLKYSYDKQKNISINRSLYQHWNNSGKNVDKRNSSEIHALCFVSILRIGETTHTHTHTHTHTYIYIYIYIHTIQSLWQPLLVQRTNCNLKIKLCFLRLPTWKLRSYIIQFWNAILTYLSSVLLLTVGWHVPQVFEIIHGTKPY